MAKKPRKLSIVSFEPWYAKKHPEAYDKSPIKLNEQVIYLGEIPNCLSHCVVVKHSGEVVWMVHTNDFRELTEDEL